jgi:hypothetical protein
MKDLGNNIQILLFQKINDQLPSHISLVDEVSGVLGITVDSAYRRIRGEKPISVFEVQKLCNHYRISFDDMVNAPINTITFHSKLLNEETFSFNGFFESMLKHFQFFEQNEKIEIVFVVNELNILQLMQVPELMAFKLFFWQKSNLGFPGYHDKFFSLANLDENILKQGIEINKKYVKIKTIELTTEENLNSFLKQILFYSEAGFFETKDDAIKLCEKLFELVDHMKLQAELGLKFRFGEKPVGEEGNFLLYYNDIILADNTILVAAGSNKITFITNNAINLIYTFNENFYNYNYNWFKNLIQRSTLISGIGEKERSKYFLKQREKIQAVIEKLR